MLHSAETYRLPRRRQSLPMRQRENDGSKPNRFYIVNQTCLQAAVFYATQMQDDVQQIIFNHTMKYKIRANAQISVFFLRFLTLLFKHYLTVNSSCAKLTHASAAGRINCSGSAAEQTVLPTQSFSCFATLLF